MTRLNRKFRQVLALALFGLMAMMHISCGEAQSKQLDIELDKAGKIDALVSAFAFNEKFTGSILVADQGEVIYEKGFGLANMEWDIPNTPDTKFSLASVSKQFTAMLIVQLVAEEKIDLQAPISTYLPNYPKSSADIITTHQLLTHSSGIPDYGSFSNYRDFEKEHHRPEEIVALFSDLPLEFTPGEKYRYSNSGYVLLGMMIENITGKSYGDNLQERIFDPLEMHDSGYDNQRELVKSRATCYAKSWGKYYNSNYMDKSLVYSAGALYSTVEDLYLWDEALYTEKLLPKKYLDLIFKPHMNTGSRHYGYGWFIGVSRSGKSKDAVTSLSHGGGMGDFRTLITRIPANKSFVVMLSNADGSALHEINYSIENILNDQPFDMPEKSVAFSVAEIIEKNGVSAGFLLLEELKNANGYYMDEHEMVILGYDFLFADDAANAAAIFEVCIAEFPRSFNVYDSYGEALMALGKNEAAIENYKMSVEINPGNQNGLRMLEKLGVDADELMVKVPIEYLQLVEGEYAATHESYERKEHWNIILEVVDGELVCNDRDYQYTLMPVGENRFVNQEYMASAEFDTDNEDEITLLFSGTTMFEKVEP